ncbi:MAG: BtrH N-terminal domain-containing protein [Pseudomonadota bacterium]
MKTIEGFEHRVASHCETGSLGNMLRHSGMEISEPMVFGVGSGPSFYYLFFAKGPGGFPLLGLRNTPGSIVKNVAKACGIGLFFKKYRNTECAMRKANELINRGTPVAACVDMFYMKYLPGFLRVHAPFHFIVLIGREGDSYAVSDPYSNAIGELAADDLRAAWETNALFAKNNLVTFVTETPKSVDWKRVTKDAIWRTCKAMLLPPVFNNIFSFVGVGGIRSYAKAIKSWPKKYSGSFLREGILFSAICFEDQGTGGGAFRTMYSAFLQEVAEIHGSQEIDELAKRMFEHGQSWRGTSKELVELGKKIPQKNDEFAVWFGKHGKDLEQGLGEISSQFMKKAAFEERFFKDLSVAGKRL